MIKKTLYILATLAIAISFTSCNTVPITGRKQINFMPNSIMYSQSASQYAETIKKSKLANNTSEGQKVRRVGLRIARATEDFLREQKIKMNFDWEFNLIDDKQVNAWAMPGGKIAFYTGILKHAQSEAEIATVMGHEVAHVIAEHGSERFSQQLGITGLSLLGAYSVRKKDAKTRQAFQLAFGAAATYGLMLPFSRKHELEADRIGLILMARAGYNPEVSVGFWQKMSQGGGAKPPEIMSTHPSDSTRIQQIRQYLPEALVWYQP